MKNRVSKVLFGILAVAAFMVCGHQVLAAEGAAARIGDVEYETLEDAVAEVKMGETITLLRANSEDIKPVTAFFIEGAAYSGNVSPGADQCLEELGTNRYVVNGKAVAYTKTQEGDDDYGKITGTLNQIFEQLYAEGGTAYSRAWMPQAKMSDGTVTEDMGFGVGLYGDTIMTADYHNMYNGNTTMGMVIMNDLTFDMNGHTYSQGEHFNGWGGYPVFANGCSFYNPEDHSEYYEDAIFSSTNLTIKDSSENGTGRMTGCVFAVYSKTGNITLESGTLATDASAHMAEGTGICANETNWNGTIYNEYRNYENTIMLFGDSSFTMNGGTVSNSAKYTNGFTGSGCIRLSGQGNQVTINGGKLEMRMPGEGNDDGIGDYDALISVRGSVCRDAVVTIYDGVFDGYIGNIYFKPADATAISTNILGGTFSIEDYVDSAYQGTCTYTEYLFGKVPSIRCLSSYTSDDSGKEFFEVGPHHLTMEGQTANCEEEGFRGTFFCGLCSQFFASEDCREVITAEDAEKMAFDIVPAKGHNWDKEFTVDQKATCTENGRRSVHCADCGAVKYELAIPAKGHSYGEWETVSSPDCENAGSKKHTCTGCGLVETEDIDPLGHQWKWEYKIDTEADCTTEGSKSIHCENCDAQVLSMVIPAKGHSYVDGKCAVCKEEDPKAAAEAEAAKAALAAAKKELADAVSDVQAVINAGQAGYTDASWNAFLTVYKEAQSLAEDADVTAVKAVYKKLEEAKAALALKPAEDSAQEPAGSVTAGKEYESSSGRYMVTDGKKKIAKLVWAKKTAKATRTIPKMVTLNGVKCKVTEIGDKAFYGLKQVKKVTLSKNVTTIGKQAFYGCKNLKQVVIKTKKLKTIKNGAFRKTSKKITVTFKVKKMTKQKKTTLVKKMKRAGMSKKAKIK